MSTGLMLFFGITTILGIAVVIIFSVDSIGAKIFGDDTRKKN